MPMFDPRFQTQPKKISGGVESDGTAFGDAFAAKYDNAAARTANDTLNADSAAKAAAARSQYYQDSSNLARDQFGLEQDKFGLEQDKFGLEQSRLGNNKTSPGSTPSYSGQGLLRNPGSTNPIQPSSNGMSQEYNSSINPLNAWQNPVDTMSLLNQNQNTRPNALGNFGMRDTTFKY